MDSRSLAEAFERFGRTAFAFDALQSPDRYGFFASERVPGAVVPYRALGRSAAVIGEPLAPEEQLP